MKILRRKSNQQQFLLREFSVFVIRTILRTISNPTASGAAKWDREDCNPITAALNYPNTQGQHFI